MNSALDMIYHSYCNNTILVLMIITISFIDSNTYENETYDYCIISLSKFVYILSYVSHIRTVFLVNSYLINHSIMLMFIFQSASNN